MGGEVTVQLTNESLDKFISGERVTINTDHAMEFYLTLKPGGSKDALVEFTPWFNMADCRVKIKNSVAIDGEFHDALEVILYNREDRSVGLELNVEQAEKLALVLQHYAQARLYYEALKEDQPTA